MQNSMLVPNFYGPHNQLFSPDYFLQELESVRDLLHSELMHQMEINLSLLKKITSPPTEQGQSNANLKNFHQNNDQDRKNSSEKNIETFDSNNRCGNEINSGILKNDTKNIPKNYGKAILTFIQESPLTREIVEEHGLRFPEFMTQIRRIKKKVSSIENLRKMWGSENYDNTTRKCIRILSYIFMRKHCLNYIFNSKVRNFGTHIKYRKKLLEGVERPAHFTHIKDF